MTFEDLAWIKSQWPGKLVVKGIQTVADAQAVADLGVDGIVLSNHGGRQLDGAPSSISSLRLSYTASKMQASAINELEYNFSFFS